MRVPKFEYVFRNQKPDNSGDKVLITESAIKDEALSLRSL
jgi:hypothetical protein